VKAIVLFDTLYGNTERVANSLAKGMREKGVEVDCVNIKSASLDKLSDYDLLAVGAPTQALTASKPMKEFLSRIEKTSFRNKYGFAFDTRFDTRFAGSAAKYIEKKLREMDLEIVRPRSSAIVTAAKGAVLAEGAEENFEVIGGEIAEALIRKKTPLGVS
jgi:flavorubredoxin